MLHPFRFSEPEHAQRPRHPLPGDHDRPQRLRPGGPAPLTFVLTLHLNVQHGRELPRIISRDMKLTKDDSGLVSDASLGSKRACTVTVTEGAPGAVLEAPIPTIPTARMPAPGLQVEGTLLIQGNTS